MARAKPRWWLVHTIISPAQHVAFPQASRPFTEPATVSKCVFTAWTATLNLRAVRLSFVRQPGDTWADPQCRQSPAGQRLSCLSPLLVSKNPGQLPGSFSQAAAVLEVGVQDLRACFIRVDDDGSWREVGSKGGKRLQCVLPAFPLLSASLGLHGRSCSKGHAN